MSLAVRMGQIGQSLGEENVEGKNKKHKSGIGPRYYREEQRKHSDHPIAIAESIMDKALYPHDMTE